MTTINYPEYGEIVRKVFQRYGISNWQPWEEIGPRRQEPHVEAAKAVIQALMAQGMLTERAIDAIERAMSS